MEGQRKTSRMERISVQLPADLLAGLQDLARREGKELQPMLREILQAVVDGDDPGRVVSVGTREAIDALRHELQQGEAARAQALTEAIQSLQEEVRQDREEAQGARAALTTVFSDLQERVDRVLQLHTPPGLDKSTPGPLGRFFRIS